MKKSCDGSEHSFDRPTAAVITHARVLQKKSFEGCTQGSRTGRPIAAVGIHMCVFLHTHMSRAEQVNGSFDIFKTLADR